MPILEFPIRIRLLSGTLRFYRFKTLFEYSLGGGVFCGICKDFYGFDWFSGSSGAESKLHSELILLLGVKFSLCNVVVGCFYYTFICPIILLTTPLKTEIGFIFYGDRFWECFRLSSGNSFFVDDGSIIS